MMADRITLAAVPKTLRRVEQFMKSPGGVDLNTIHWEIPAEESSTGAGAAGDSSYPPTIGAILFCHGYGHYCAVVYDWLASVLRQFGIAAFGIEHEGHGKSGGTKGYIPNFDELVDNVLEWAAVIKERLIPANIPLFIHGESLGGGIAIHASLKQPEAFAGMTLFAPMVGLTEGRAPSYIVEQLGRLAASIMPTAPLAPVKDVLPDCFRDPTMYALQKDDPFRYQGKLRLGTAFELKGAMDALAASYGRVSTPFIILHGSADKVTSHEASRRLFDECPSQDKTFITYEGAWHVLWTESVDTRENIFHDWISWMLERCPPRRASLSLPVAETKTRPLGVRPFQEEGHPLTIFSLATHRHLYEGSNPIHSPIRERSEAGMAIHSPAHPRHHLHHAHALHHRGPHHTGERTSHVGAEASE